MITRYARLARTLLAPALALALLLATRAPAAPEPNAQPNQAPQPPRAEVPPDQAPGAQGDGQGGERQKNQRARREAEREKRSQNLRRVMTSMGFSDRALQDEVLRYISSEVRERSLVRRKAQEIYAVLRDPARTDDEVRGLLHEYQAVVEADLARRRKAEDAFNERIHFRANPRLEAMLTLFGIIGDSPIALPQRQPR